MADEAHGQEQKLLIGTFWSTLAGFYKTSSYTELEVNYLPQQTKKKEIVSLQDTFNKMF